MTSIVSTAPRPRAAWIRSEWVRGAAEFAAVTAIAFIGWGLLLHELDLELPTSHRFAYLARALAVLVSLTAWTAWQTRREERRLAAARQRIRDEEIALSEARLRAEQAEGLAAFARVLAHELRNPLNAMALHAALVKRAGGKLGPEGERIRGAALVIDAELRRMNELLDDYLACSKASAMVIAQDPLSIEGVAAEAAAEMRDALARRGVQCHVQPGEGLPNVRGDRDKLAQAIHHVLSNAAEVMTSGGRVEIRASYEDGHVALTITDDGPGFEDPDAVFRPFFTTHSAAGLGMAVVRDIVRAHRGEVDAENTAEGGARISIRLPAGET